MACTKTLQHYLAIGSVRPLPADTTDGLWSTFFPVPKKGTDKMRGCVDLRCPNECIKYEHFKMEGLHTVRDLLRRRDFMAKVDLSDYFFHLPIPLEHREYFRFMWQGKKYQCTAMPFGLAPAPRLATKILQPVIRHLRSMGVRHSLVRSSKLTGGISLDAFVGNANHHGIEIAILSRAKKDGMFVLSSPKVGS